MSRAKYRELHVTSLRFFQATQRMERHRTADLLGPTLMCHVTRHKIHSYPTDRCDHREKGYHNPGIEVNDPLSWQTVRTVLVQANIFKYPTIASSQLRTARKDFKGMQILNRSSTGHT